MMEMTFWKNGGDIVLVAIKPPIVEEVHSNEVLKLLKGTQYAYLLTAPSGRAKTGPDSPERPYQFSICVG